MKKFLILALLFIGLPCMADYGDEGNLYEFCSDYVKTDNGCKYYERNQLHHLESYKQNNNYFIKIIFKNNHVEIIPYGNDLNSLERDFDENIEMIKFDRKNAFDVYDIIFWNKAKLIKE